MADSVNQFTKWFKQLEEAEKLALTGHLYGVILEHLNKKNRQNLELFSEGLFSGPSTMKPLMKGLFSGPAGRGACPACHRPY